MPFSSNLLILYQISYFKPLHLRMQKDAKDAILTALSLGGNENIGNNIILNALQGYQIQFTTISTDTIDN